MLVGDRRYAAQAVDGGERRFFDDVGCMASWFEGRGEEPAHAWVRDAEAARWVDVRRARFAPGAKTPMDFGFEAREGGPLGWAEVRERVRAARRGP
ncbi:MAG: hypothetical protein MUF34_17960 [Polyangiaceae bacterium]|jgi:hypothetical protein|nr:hypothetical protein [Polyangiaceae bacterium]